jgi:hypothetical protein
VRLRTDRELLAASYLGEAGAGPIADDTHTTQEETSR